MTTYGGTGPVRVSTANGRTMIECWSEPTTDDPMEQLGYFRVGGLDQRAWEHDTYETTVHPRAQWSIEYDEADQRTVAFNMTPLPPRPTYTMTDPDPIQIGD